MYYVPGKNQRDDKPEGADWANDEKYDPELFLDKSYRKHLDRLESIYIYSSIFLFISYLHICVYLSINNEKYDPELILYKSYRQV